MSGALCECKNYIFGPFLSTTNCSQEYIKYYVKICNFYMRYSKNERAHLRYTTPGCKLVEILKPGEDTTDNDIIVKINII